MTRIALCVVTYRRPGPLQRLLESLQSLEVDECTSLSLVIVDNDEAAEGRAVVEAIGSDYPWAIHYTAGTVRNIAVARNRAIEVALESDPEAIAFVDDDEVVDPHWLRELLRLKRATGAEIVAGPVLPEYAPGVPEWIVRGRFFEIPRYPTGTRVSMAFTGNVLLDRSVLVGEEGRFSPAFGANGGEDSHFFMRAHLRGTSMVWADDAIVRESVPTSRAHGVWILKRAFRVGNQSVACERALLPVTVWLLPRLVKATVRIAQGLVTMLPAAFLGRRGIVASARKIAHGAGCLSSIFGFDYGEY